MAEPERLTVGDTWEWTKSVANYPSTDGNVLTYSLTNASYRTVITASGVADGTYSISVPAATTADFEAGEFIWRAHVTNGADRYTVERGVFHVEPDPDGTLVDLQTTVKQTLDALDAMILGKASQDQISYSINGRSISRLSPDELITWRNYYQRLYARERSQASVDAGNKSGNRVLASF